MSPRRDGFVIAVTLLVMLLLEVLAGGMLLIALHERAITLARIGITAARARAEGALAHQVGTWTVGEFHRMRIGEVRTIESETTNVHIERLRGDLFLLTGTAPVRPGSSRGFGRAVLLLRAFDTQLLQQQLTGALVVAGPTQLLGESQIHAPAWPDGCVWTGAPPAAVATTRPDLLAVAASAELTGLIPVLVDTFPREPSTRLAGVTSVELARLADRTAAGTITPAPSHRDRTCNEATPQNWGAPLEPDDPCADYAPFIFADGDLEIAGGAGQGLLVVTGNLVMRNGAEFHGVIVVGGSVLLADATVRGAFYARSSAAPTVLLDATVTFDPCAAQNALFSPRSLRRPLFPPGRIWLPAH